MLPVSLGFPLLIAPSVFSIVYLYCYYKCVLVMHAEDLILLLCIPGRHGRDRMVVGFTTTHAISTFHHKRCKREYR